jgi:hypothetical protein
MSTIVTRAGKGSPLTNTELDSNFSNLNTDKAELSGANFTGSIDVTGSVVADGLTVQDTSKAVEFAGFKSNGVGQSGSNANGEIVLGITSAYQGIITYNGIEGDMYIENTWDDASALTHITFDDKKVLTAQGNGDISFYDGSGNQGLFWDSSSSYLGLGTTTVNADLHISKTSGAKLWLTAQGNNPSDAGSLRFAELNNGNNYFEFKHDGSSNTLSLNSTNGNLVTFNRSNQSTSFSGNATLSTSGFTTLKINSTRTSGNIGGVEFTASGVLKSQIFGTVAGGMKLSSNGSTEALTIDSSQNVNIPNGSLMVGSTTAPSAKLHVSDATAPTFRLSRTGTGQIWQQSIDSSGRFILQEAASEGGTKYTRLQIDDTGEAIFSGSVSATAINLNGEETNTNPLKIKFDHGEGTSDAGLSSVSQTEGVSLALGSNAFYNASGGIVASDSNNQSMAITVDGFSSNKIKFLTAATGNPVERAAIDDSGLSVSGSVTSTGLTVNGGGNRSYFNLSHLRLSDGYKLEWGGGTNYIIGSNASNYVKIATNGSDALTLDASQNVNIPNGSLMVGSTTAPTETLTLDKSTGNVFQRFDKSGAIKGLIGVADSSAQGSSAAVQGDMILRGQTNLLLDTAGTTRLTINANGSSVFSGSVGIGTSSSSEVLGVYKDSISQAATQYGNANTGEGSGNGFIVGVESVGNGLIWNRETTYIRFGTNATERMRLNADGSCRWTPDGTNHDMTLTADGNLLVGKTSPSSATVGFQAGQDGFIAATRASAQPLVLNRTTNDGIIADFRKDSATVGTIGTFGGHPYIGGDNAGNATFLRFWTGSTPSVRPSTNSGTNADNTLDLGSSVARFKDLYLSNNATAQKLTLTKAPVGTFTIEVDGTNTGQPNLIVKKSTTEVLRIDNNKNLLVGTPSTLKANVNGLHLDALSTTHAMCVRSGGNGYGIAFQNSGGSDIGSITMDATSTTFNTTSDQRLKENIADADDAGSKIDAIQVRKYDWKADGSHQDYGMVAQELQTVAPEAVSGDADSEEMMGVDYSKLVPMLIKEIQSLRQRVAQLEE